MADTIFEVRGDGEIRRYTGNWSDWVRKREQEETPVKEETPKSAVPERQRKQKLKFSYKEEREFAVIDEEIAELEEKISWCQEEQNLCGSDYIKLQNLQTEQAELEEKLEEKMDRWVYLTELKEKIDAQ
jgi:ATP-binding cassette subfamily F protein uup